MKGKIALTKLSENSFWCMNVGSELPWTRNQKVQDCLHWLHGIMYILQLCTEKNITAMKQVFLTTACTGKEGNICAI